MSYKLRDKPVSQRNIFTLTIRADANDGDYITETSTFNSRELKKNLPEIKRLRDDFSGVNKLKTYDNPMGLNIPYDGHDGYCHTIETLTVEFIDTDSRIWDVEF